MPQVFSDKHQQKIIDSLHIDEILTEIPLIQYNEIKKELKGQERLTVGQLYDKLSSFLGKKNIKKLEKDFDKLNNEFVKELAKDFDKVGKPKLYETIYSTDLTELAETIDLGLMSYALSMNDNINEIVKDINENTKEIDITTNYNVSDDVAAYEATKAQIIDGIIATKLVDNELKITDALGRKYSLGFWAERELSTKILTDMQNTLFGEMKAYDHNLVIINYNTIASPLCIHRQNKIYYTDGKSYSNYKPLEPELWTNGGGLFHPFCRHYINAYFPGLSLEPEVPKLTVKQQEILYKQDQKLKYIQRNKKKYYQRKQRAKALDNGSYEKNVMMWKKWLEREKEFKKNML